MRNKNLERGIVSMNRVRELLRLKEEGRSQREMHGATGIARSCIQRYLGAAEEAGVTYEVAKAASDDELRTRLSRRVPGRTRERIEEPDFGTVHREYLSRKGTTLELLWQEWRATELNAYSYSTFCRRYQEWRGVEKVTYRQEYEPGDKAFSDYAGETLSYLDRSGATKSVQIFVCTLAASNLVYTEASEDQTILSWCGSHVRAFEYFGGTPRLLGIDNLKSGVTRPCRYEPELNRTFQEFGDHYQLAIVPARVKKPRDKAKVEQAVQFVERHILAPLRARRFTSCAEINEAIAELLVVANGRLMKDYGQSRREFFEATERHSLRPLSGTVFIASIWKRARVHLDYHVQVEKHWYSVPYHLCRKEVQIRITDALIEVFFNNERVASHLRSREPYRYTTAEAHLPPHHKAMKSRTRENFLSWADTIGRETKTLVETMLEEARHPEQAFRSILGLQRLAKQFTSRRLEQAASQANRAHIASQRFVRQAIEHALHEEIRAEESAPPLVHDNIRGGSYYQ
jgi:transposase